MTKNPYFSVIIPVYNRENVIANAINSVLNQTYKHWELILIDDHSIDNTSAVINSFQDPRIVYLKNKKNFGAAYSRNRGIEKAKGEVISFLDSDDLYYPEFLMRTYLFLKENNDKVSFCWTGLEVKSKNEIKKELWVPVIQNSSYYTFLKELRIGSGCGLSVKKKVFLSCGMFNEDLTAAEDTDFLLRIVQQFEFGVIKEFLVFIDKTGEDRLSLNYERNARSYNRFIHQHWSAINSFPTLKKKFYYKLMWLNFHLGEFPLARQYYMSYENEFGFSKKAFFVRILFEIFGKRLGSLIHIKLSS